MTWVITRLCRDCVDQACVDVCPMECIYEYTGDNKVKFPNQLYIDPDECIDCGACEPECPWEAIFEDVSVPDVLNEDTELNKEIVDEDNRAVPQREDKPAPTPDQVKTNKDKWMNPGSAAAAEPSASTANPAVRTPNTTPDDYDFDNEE